MMHLREEPPSLSLFNPAVPETLELIVHKVLAKEPSARYRTADQLGRILIRYREQGEEMTRAQLASTPPQPQPRAPASAHEVLPEAPTSYHSAGRAGPLTPPMAQSNTAHLNQGAPVGGDVYVPGDTGIDWIALGLGFLAFIAVAGLFPLWYWVFSLYNR
jgi:serine/threonine-protein kinase